MYDIFLYIQCISSQICLKQQSGVKMNIKKCLLPPVCDSPSPLNLRDFSLKDVAVVMNRIISQLCSLWSLSVSFGFAVHFLSWFTLITRTSHFQPQHLSNKASARCPAPDCRSTKFIAGECPKILGHYVSVWPKYQLKLPVYARK